MQVRSPTLHFVYCEKVGGVLSEEVGQMHKIVENYKNVITMDVIILRKAIRVLAYTYYISVSLPA